MLAFLALPADWFSFSFLPPSVYGSLKIALCVCSLYLDPTGREVL